MQVRKFLPKEIRSTYEGYESIINFHHSLEDFCWDNIDIDFSGTSWIDANLSALLGAIFDHETNNSIKLVNIPGSIQSILRKNDFLSFYGYPTLNDSWKTTVKYKKFKSSDIQPFTDYVYDELLSKPDLPNMSKSFKKEMARSLVEIFINAKMHGDCNYVYTCGQYFPKDNKLKFTIVDLGKTIKQNVSDFLISVYPTLDISGKKAIIWAVKKDTTTKTEKTGGLGLNITRKFIRKNQGKIQIISDSGFWEENVSDILSQEFEKSFPGTIVNLEINMKDDKDYFSKNELNDSNIF